MIYACVVNSIHFISSCLSTKLISVCHDEKHLRMEHIKAHFWLIKLDAPALVSNRFVLYQIVCFMCWPIGSWWGHVAPWASYQIHKIAGCACTGNAGNVFPATDFKGNPRISDPGMHNGTCVTHVSWYMSGSLTRGDGKNAPGISGACATRNFTYLARGPWNQQRLR